MCVHACVHACVSVHAQFVLNVFCSLLCNGLCAPVQKNSIQKSTLLLLGLRNVDCAG